MPRPVQIDRSQALKAAKGLFWVQGYSTTSMSQLLDTMGMGSGSFYAAFGSKARVFELVLADYTRSSMDQFEIVRDQHLGLEGIRAFLDRTLIDITDAERHKGCLLVNSALELDGVEPALHRHVAAGLGALEAAISRSVKDARELGTLRRDITDREAVGLLMSLLHGLRAESRLGLSREAARQRVDTLLALIANTDEGAAM